MVGKIVQEPMQVRVVSTRRGDDCDFPFGLFALHVVRTYRLGILYVDSTVRE
jgi:hypothetical protein